MPSATRSWNARRTVCRLTPCCSASSNSVGSLRPPRYLPAAMCSRSCFDTSWYAGSVSRSRSLPFTAPRPYVQVPGLQPPPRHELRDDDVALDLVGAPTDDHQRGAPEVPL